jgi:hypothetical protein
MRSARSVRNWRDRRRALCTSIGGEAQSFKYFLSPGYADGLPYVVEIATCAYKKWVQDGAPGRELGPTRSFLITAMTGGAIRTKRHGERRPERRTGLTRGEAGSTSRRHQKRHRASFPQFRFLPSQSAQIGRTPSGTPLPRRWQHLSRRWHQVRYRHWVLLSGRNDTSTAAHNATRARRPSAAVAWGWSCPPSAEVTRMPIRPRSSR